MPVCAPILHLDTLSETYLKDVVFDICFVQKTVRNDEVPKCRICHTNQKMESESDIMFAQLTHFDIHQVILLTCTNCALGIYLVYVCFVSRAEFLPVFASFIIMDLSMKVMDRKRDRSASNFIAYVLVQIVPV